ncbi:MFS general substrate transporter [Neolentinus lepideus HHB14362 ss-1]|uniref:MFS general substrate transporter n=1 Tax=Neolentinus lepideus HHB14362 ss-1 TaxID=1314782 RepID=A0A165R2A3_9AGAM|nr:MFS general substrate transporter [Neolentinus lepideus HHB14362 ss-1]
MSESKTPSLISPRRLTTLFASLLVALGAGTNYVYSAYAPQLGSRLKINHTQLNIIGLAGNVGVYSSGPIWGRIVDNRGPRLLLVVAFTFLLLGYMGIRHVYDAGPTAYDSIALALLVTCGFLTGSGGNAGLTSVMNSTAKSFPDQARATSTGIVLSGFGLSAFFFSTIAHVAFPGNTSDFLLILAIGTSLPMIIGFFLVRPVPLPPAEPAHILESGAPEEEDMPDVTVETIFQQENNSSTRLLADRDGTESTVGHEQQVTDYVVPHTSDAVELSPTRSDVAGLSRHRSRSRVALGRSRSRVSVKTDDHQPNIHGKFLWTSSDFWLFFIMMSLLSGTGLMWINNVGSISEALSAKGNPNYDQIEASRWQASQVSTVSITNCLGRFLVGILADFAKNQLHLPRSYCATVVSTLFLISQLTAISIGDVSELWKASALLGLSYGSMFGLYPTLCIEWFGMPHFSENWGFLSLAPLLGGNVFSIAFGRNLDAHAAPEDADQVVESSSQLTRRGGLPSTHQCFEGGECYIASLYMTTIACLIALGLSIWVSWRDRNRTVAGSREKFPAEVVWEEEEEEEA